MGWAFVKWLRYCKTTSQMQELGRMWSTVTCQLNQNQICYSNSSFLVNCFSRVLSTQFFAILVFLKKSKQKGKIHCRTLSIFNVVILKISNKILPFVSVMHNQLCTGGWQIAAQSTGNGQCSADPHGAACRIPGWSCHTDLTAGSSCGFPLWCVQHSCHPQLWCSTCHVWLSLCLRLLPRVQGWLWALLSFAGPAQSQSSLLSCWGPASGADGHTAHGESRAHFPCFAERFSCFGSWEIL